VISATGLTRSFGSDRVLDGIDLRAEPGEILGIIGPGGAGKSLLLKMLCGLMTPDGGRIEVDGQDIASLDGGEMSKIREKFGMLFQNYALFDFMNVGDNIAFPLRQRGEITESEIVDRVNERLGQVDLPGAHALFPRELSGGMKKRVALARATIAEAPYLLYDDPTAGLDPVTSSKIFGLITQLHRSESITIIVSHDVDRMIPVCHRWIMIYDGLVRFRGNIEEAMASDDEVVRTFFDGSDTDVSAAGVRAGDSGSVEKNVDSVTP
jgi:phospholipid/cholesterol/gamma-HCH transport system ATP-binding protein